MRTIFALLVVLTATAHAEPTDLGGYHLGQKLKKAKVVDATVFGCAGTVTPIVKKHKVVEVYFVSNGDDEGCALDEENNGFPAKLSDAISAATGTQPIDNAQGDRLWEGTKASLVLTGNGLKLGGPALELDLVAPGAGSKRACWPDDGFAAFFTAFQQAIAGGDPTALATSFQYPFHDDVGDGSFKNARAFAKKWKQLLDDDATASLTAEDARPYCWIDDGQYVTYIGDGSRGLLVAKPVKGAWKWVRVISQPQD